MSEHVEWQELHELLKELAQKEYGDKYGEQIFWYFQDVIDDSCKLDVLEEENKRLNNIINELEKEIDRLLERQYASERFAEENGFCTYLPAKENLLCVKNKLQELKGSDEE